MSIVRCATEECDMNIEAGGLTYSELKWYLWAEGWTYDTTWGRWKCPAHHTEQEET